MSYDSLAVLAAFHEVEALNYPLLSDADTRHFAAYGVLNPEYPPGHEAHGIALPGVLFVTPDAVVQLKFAVPGYRERPAMEDIYSGLKAWLAGREQAARASVSTGEADGAVRVVIRLQDSLLDAMREQGSLVQREVALGPVVAAVFDVGTIARIALGPTWRKLDESARKDFVDRMQVLITATYAARFKTDNGLSFRVLTVSESSRGPVVRTQLLRPMEDPVRLDYYLRDGRIFDVVADGVSDLSLRRSDYSSIVESNGYPALLEDLDARITELRSDDAT